MKKTNTQVFGNIFIFIGLICLALWGYAKYEQSPIPSHSIVQSGGSAPQPEKIDDSLISPKESLSMGVVELNVENLEKETQFYRDIVGFDTITKSGNTINLGENGKTFLRLIEEKNFTFPARSEAGLYHIAITHNSRKDLATRAKNILTKVPERYQGSADHSATEAFYFSDPEGNGVELYYDKPRKDWIWKDGKPEMGSSYIDTGGYIKKYAEIPVGEGVTTMGHVHLKVGNISQAVAFYENTLLFEEMNNRGDALFISRDKYHHHLGMNTWESLGAGQRTKNTYGLKSFELIYHDQNLFEQVRKNLGNKYVPVDANDNKGVTVDPWGNTIYMSQEN